MGEKNLLVDEEKNLGDTSANLRTEQGWQPIETAPKDGGEVILGHGNSVWVDRWVKDDLLDDGGYWEECETTLDTPEVPSHWMPLPDPPEVKD